MTGILARIAVVFGALVLLVSESRAEGPIVLNLWPDKPPGETGELLPEADLFKEGDKLIAGRKITKLGSISTPQIAVYRPPAEKANGATAVICPGGGH